jgi:heterotetrameric sarcosine oxidase gamma subunit
MDNLVWTKQALWDTYLDGLAHHSEQDSAGIVVTPIEHGFSADLLLPRTSPPTLHQDVPALGFSKTHQGVRLACLTPWHYLVHANERPDAAFFKALFGSDDSMVDQTGARAALVVSGPKIQDCLRRGVMIDLDPSVFPISAFASTYAGHINLHITSLGQDRFELSCARSMVGSFWHWLSQTAAPFGLARGH